MQRPVRLGHAMALQCRARAGTYTIHCREVPLTPILSRHDRSTPRPAAQVERVLAVGRAFLTVTGFIAIYLDPTEPAHLREVTYLVLLGYAAYSLIVLVYIHSTSRVTPRYQQTLHGLDILWTSALTFVSQGPVSPFFLFFMFVVLAAAYRWGFRETAGTAVLTVAIFLLETGVAVAGPWNEAWFASMALDLNRTILRVSYLLLTGVLLGYLAEQEKISRAELAATADAARQPNVNLGLGGSVAAVARTFLSMFDAAAVAVVVKDHETGRTLLWRLERPDGANGPPHVHRRELNLTDHATWLFETPGRAWHAVLDRKPSEVTIARATEADVWRLRRREVTLPAAFHEAVGCRTVTAVRLGLAGEWEARTYLFGIGGGGSLERRLHFLEALADYMTPGLTNVFLLRRLRARAGAAERARVARELHDGAIQALFGIDMKLEAMRRESHRPAAEIGAELAEIQGLLRREVLALRELMQALRPIEIDSGEQLPDVLASLVERFRRDTGISARFISTGGRIAVPPSRALEIVRIVQEALVNVRKHSEARNVLVRLVSDNASWRIVIEDDGRGFEFEGRLSARELDERRIGPAIIKERARLAGADLIVDSAPGAGARVELAFAEQSHG